MKTKKFLGLLLAVSMVGTTFSGVTVMAEEDTEAEAAEEAEVAEEADTEGLKIGLTVYDLANPYFVSVANGAQDRCDELGIELMVNDPQSDSSAQVTAIENFITMDVDAIIVCPLDTAACESIIEEAHDKGIAIVSQSSCTDTHDVWVSAEEYDMGYVCGGGLADWLVENYGEDVECTVAVLGWDQISTQVARGDGMEDAITEKCPNVNIVRQDADSTAAGQEVTDSLLQAYPDLQGIVCLNDAGAIGALSAVQAAGKDNDDFYIGGIDATDEGLSLVAEDNCFRATEDLIPYENGGIDVDLAVQLINGETIDDTYVIPAKLVNASNIDDYDIE